MDNDNYSLLRTEVWKTLEKTLEEKHTGIDYYWLLHMEEVAILCRLIALKRGLDTDICRCAGLLHDIWLACQTFPIEAGLHGQHGYRGSETARDMLKKNGGYSDEKINIICEMIYNHNDKHIVHDEYSEALKDADALQHHLNGDNWYGQNRLERGSKVAEEL
jgi:HD superfamily phosphodiesterase